MNEGKFHAGTPKDPDRDKVIKLTDKIFDKATDCYAILSDIQRKYSGDKFDYDLYQTLQDAYKMLDSIKKLSNKIEDEFIDDSNITYITESKKLFENTENKSGTAIVAFGRMNPPTIGHLKLLRKMDDLVETTPDESHAYMFLSHSVDKKKEFKNPLSYDKKLYYVNELIKQNGLKNVTAVESNAKTVIDALHELYEMEYKNVIFVGGEDRIGGDEDMTATISKYNGVETSRPEQYYKFDSIKFENAGHRDDTSNDITEKASASYARQLVKEGDRDTFDMITSLDEATTDELWNELNIILEQENGE